MSQLFDQIFQEIPGIILIYKNHDCFIIFIKLIGLFQDFISKSKGLTMFYNNSVNRTANKTVARY